MQVPTSKQTNKKQKQKKNPIYHIHNVTQVVTSLRNRANVANGYDRFSNSFVGLSEQRVAQ